MTISTTKGRIVRLALIAALLASALAAWNATKSTALAVPQDPIPSVFLSPQDPTPI